MTGYSSSESGKNQAKKKEKRQVRHSEEALCLYEEVHHGEEALCHSEEVHNEKVCCLLQQRMLLVTAKGKWIKKPFSSLS